MYFFMLIEVSEIIFQRKHVIVPISVNNSRLPHFLSPTARLITLISVTLIGIKWYLVMLTCIPQIHWASFHMFGVHWNLFFSKMLACSFGKIFWQIWSLLTFIHLYKNSLYIIGKTFYLSSLYTYYSKSVVLLLTWFMIFSAVKIY